MSALVLPILMLQDCKMIHDDPFIGERVLVTEIICECFSATYISA